MTITTLCLPELPPQPPCPHHESVSLAAADAVMSDPVLDGRVAIALDALCAALLDAHAATDSPEHQRRAAYLIRGALLGRNTLPLWLVRRGQLHRDKWVRSWVDRTVPLGPRQETHVPEGN
ncbi:MAG: hypothetical protein O9319_00260 [Gemmatimonas sp.]|uniref:hypothetical protein n=1 Tax=Gemmatimonas sp. TaxID=1962908 RepID=UPI0022BBCD5E|nr:hypothetical protein [Gemmatimonas sp.]MCZ8012988.1 hypothetical protein [Gemmatimonas sp.]MCZ8265262.1 hypothetical protein [Gemmatimonas sp.]